MKMVRGTRYRMWTFDEYVEEYEKLLAQLTKAEEETKSLLAEKDMAGMGFVSKGAAKEIDSLHTQLARTQLAEAEREIERLRKCLWRIQEEADIEAQPPGDKT